MTRSTDDDLRARFGLPPGTPVRRHRGGDAPERVALDPGTLHVVTLQSAIDGADWDAPVVVAGHPVRLSVRTTFLGDGNTVAVTLRDARDRTLGRATATAFRDRSSVELTPDRQTAAREPDGVLAAADIEVPSLGLRAVAPPLRVLPYAELSGARWDRGEAREGDVVALTCAVTGTPGGCQRVARSGVELEVLRGTADDLFEPVATFTAAVEGDQANAQWRVGYDAEGRALIATQAELDDAAERAGAEPGLYAAPVYRFRARALGLAAESGDLAYQDWVEFAFTDADEAPYADLGVTVEHPDGQRTEATTGADGIVRVEPAPPGTYRVVEVREPPADAETRSDAVPPSP